MPYQKTAMLGDYMVTSGRGSRGGKKARNKRNKQQHVEEVPQPESKYKFSLQGHKEPEGGYKPTEKCPFSCKHHGPSAHKTEDCEEAKRKRSNIAAEKEKQRKAEQVRAGAAAYAASMRDVVLGSRISKKEAKRAIKNQKKSS